MTAKPSQLNRFRFGLRSLFVGVTIVGLLFAYLAVYWRLAERGRAVQREARLAGFFYVEISEDGYDVFWHRMFIVLFYPANQMDQMILGGSPPCSGGTIGLSAPKSPSSAKVYRALGPSSP